MPAQRKPRHKRPAPRRVRQGVAVTVTGVVSAGVVVGGAGVAQAADRPVSQARGVFLSGSALGIDLDDIVSLKSAKAVNDGDDRTVKDLNPLEVSLLNSLDVPLGPVNLLEGNGLLSLGAVNQAAVARSNGSAVGASGAVTDSGAIAVGGEDDVPPANATLDLGGLLESTLGTDLVGDLVDLDLTVGAISANAKQDKGEDGRQRGDYQIADLTLDLQSPLLAGLLDGLNLGSLQGQVGGLDGVLNGLDLDTLLAPVLGTLGLENPQLTAGNLPILSDIVGDQDLTLGSGAVRVDLTDGTITVDVEELLKALGLDLNDLPPNTELVSTILEGIVSNVADLVSGAVEDLVDDLTDAIEAITVTGQGSALLGGALTPITDLTGIAGQLDTVLDGLLDTVLAPVDDLLEDVVGPLLDPIFDALEQVLSIRVNVQQRSNGRFTERALQVRVLPSDGDSLATINLASASVGPGDLDDDSDDPDDPDLPQTGAGGSAPLAAAGLGLLLAGAAATGVTRHAAGPAAPRARSRGRHARR
ncbi:MAG: choice-of-anchor G family protein [Sporichthyaceae bacterium]